MKLKPRTKPQKTNEGQREEQCKGPDRERSLYWSSLKKGSVWLESIVRKRVRDEVKSPRANSYRILYIRTKSCRFLPNEMEDH